MSSHITFFLLKRVSEVASGSEDRPLGRSQTTLNVPADARDRTTPSPISDDPPKPTGVTRSATQITPGRPSPQNAGMGGPVRGLSVRKPAAPGQQGPPAPAKGKLHHLNPELPFMFTKIQLVGVV